MAFTINQTGFERGATQLIFDDPPILLDRHEEEAQDAAYAVAISGEPITTQFNRAQSKSFLRLRLRLVKGSDVTTLVTLMEGAGPVTVKLVPGDATTIQCMFGPREDQQLIPYNDDYATGKSDGSAVDPIFTQYKAELFLLRL
jgi:hypothetical protein